MGTQEMEDAGKKMRESFRQRIKAMINQGELTEAQGVEALKGLDDWDAAEKDLLASAASAGGAGGDLRGLGVLKTYAGVGPAGD